MEMKGILTHEYNIPPSQNTNTSGTYLVMTVAQTTSMWSQTNPGYYKQVLTTDLQCWVVFDFDEDHPVLVLENALEWFWFQVRFLEKLNPDSNLGVFLFFFKHTKRKISIPVLDLVLKIGPSSGLVLDNLDQNQWLTYS